MREHRLSPKTKQTIVSFFAGATYFWWVVALLLLAAIYLERIITSPAGRVVMPGPSEDRPGPVHLADGAGFSVPELPFFVTSLLAVLMLAGLVVGLIYAFRRVYAPTVNRTAEAVVHKVAEVGTNQAVKHKIIKKRGTKRFSRQLVFWVKVVISLLPALIVYLFAPGDYMGLAEKYWRAAVLVPVNWALISVGFEYLLAERWQIQS